MLNEDEEEKETGDSKVKAEEVKPSDGSKELKDKKENMQKEVLKHKIEKEGETDVANEKVIRQ